MLSSPRYGGEKHELSLFPPLGGHSFHLPIHQPPLHLKHHLKGSRLFIWSCSDELPATSGQLGRHPSRDPEVRVRPPQHLLHLRAAGAGGGAAAAEPDPGACHRD